MHGDELDFLKLVIMNYFDLESKDFFFKSRLNNIVYARRIFFYLAEFHLKKQQTFISDYLKCPLSSVSYGKNKIIRLLASGDKELINDLKQIKKLLSNKNGKG
tara:strand:+ start:292 stop:600 length:309 start_codon:yes stop_codon:yes gene_type:complete